MNIQRDEDFEKAYSEICKPIIARPYPRNEKGEYIYQEIHEAYLMWQAKAQAVPEGFVLVDEDTMEDIKDSFSLLQEDIAVHRDYGTEHTARRDFNEILERVTKLKAMIEAWEQNQEDAELNAIADSRKGQKRISVNIDEI